MVGFMLDGAREQTATAELEGVAFPIQGLYVNDVRAADLGENLRKTQAAFRAAHGIADGHYLRVEKNQRHEFRHVGGLPVEFERGRAIGNAPHVEDGHLQRQANLLRGQADAFVVYMVSSMSQ